MGKSVRDGVKRGRNINRSARLFWGAVLLAGLFMALFMHSAKAFPL
ncbi:hypothetical protein P3339_15595 [Microbulbifer sp. MLAF003]|nr:MULTISPECIES: hypothetical protein [Microbulbifer]WHI49878.1 hypothetical protein P3339_15595 [Microbulbifer sp. MLAF003]